MPDRLRRGSCLAPLKPAPACRPACPRPAHGWPLPAPPPSTPQFGAPARHALARCSIPCTVALAGGFWQERAAGAAGCRVPLPLPSPPTPCASGLVARRRSACALSLPVQAAPIAVPIALAEGAAGGRITSRAAAFAGMPSTIVMIEASARSSGGLQPGHPPPPRPQRRRRHRQAGGARRPAGSQPAECRGCRRPAISGSMRPAARGGRIPPSCAEDRGAGSDRRYSAGSEAPRAAVGRAPPLKAAAGRAAGRPSPAGALHVHLQSRYC